MTMTRQEQLDAVVRNYGEWNDVFNDGVAFWLGDLEGVGYTDSHNINALKCPAFTRAEVEQRKAELQNKPSWDDAPEWAESRTQDSDGTWSWWSIGGESLDPGDPGRPFWIYNSEGITVKHTKASKGEVIGDWRETLEKRPVADDHSQNKLSAPYIEDFADHNKMIIDELRADQEKPTLKSGETMEDAINNTVKALGLDSERIPPVGSDCFLLLGFEDFGKCKITYMGDGVFCYRHYKSDKEYTGSLNAAVFRPIKSDREKWVEAAMSGLSYAVDESPEDIIGMIHDAMVSGQLPAPEVKK